MDKYILNRNKQDSDSGENYEIHNESEGCSYLPDLANRIELGYFSNCEGAMKKAEKEYPQWAKDINGCYYCANDCHTE